MLGGSDNLGVVKSCSEPLGRDVSGRAAFSISSSSENEESFLMPRSRIRHRLSLSPSANLMTEEESVWKEHRYDEAVSEQKLK